MPKSMGKTLVAMGATTFLTACALPERPDPPIAAAVAQPELSIVAQWLGSYRSMEEPAFNLDITQLAKVQPSDSQSHQWRQWTDENLSDPRRFIISYSSEKGYLESHFAPINNGQIADRRCRVDWQITTDTQNTPTLFGQTLPSECRFSTPSGALGLLKEWSFDGQTIRVADQLIDLSNGRPMESAQVIEFVRIERFEGWAAVEEADEWRVDQALVVWSDGQRRASQDAAGMSLNIGITLERKHTAGETRLQLVVSDEKTGEVLGQAWSSPDVERIGWSNNSVQVELIRQSRRVGATARSNQ